MEYSLEHTPSGYLVFVAHTHIPKADGSVKEKGCVILDIRGLNAQAKPDLYQLPSQEELIGMARGCPLTSVIDATSFFYQWRAKSGLRTPPSHGTDGSDQP
jgi:hypothetical protein